MIRFFTDLCKAILNRLTDEDIFMEATYGFKCRDKKCPSCRISGKLSPYGDYSRNLVSREDGKTVVRRVNVLRFKCETCKATHALLPGIIIPYCQYSLIFILTVLIAYFERDTTVEAVCVRFEIAVSTLYEWKKLLIAHKELLHGFLTIPKAPAHTFLRGLIETVDISNILGDFFRRYSFSFLQSRSAPLVDTAFLIPP